MLSFIENWETTFAKGGFMDEWYLSMDVKKQINK